MLERSQLLKEACNQKYVSVTFDLAIAMPALKHLKTEGGIDEETLKQLLLKIKIEPYTVTKSLPSEIEELHEKFRNIGTLL